MNAAEVQRVYESVASALRKRNLRRIKLPALHCGVVVRSSSTAPACKKKKAQAPPYTVGGLMLVFFASRLGKIAEKTELVAFLRAMRCGTVDPQPRHLGMQLGLNFLVQGCYHPKAKRALRRGEYCLLDLRNAHPSHATMHRAKAELSWEPLKALYGSRCACCGSVEGERHLKNDHLLTTLEKGHCDPRLPLTDDNCIPMCKLCNMVYKDHAVLNRRGFVVEWLRRRTATIADDSAEEAPSALSSVSSSNVESGCSRSSRSSSSSAVDELEEDPRSSSPMRPSRRFWDSIRAMATSIASRGGFWHVPGDDGDDYDRPIRRAGAFFGGGSMRLF